jgi:RNA polymerase sigma-70 factor (ECF subfamily)
VIGKRYRSGLGESEEDLIRALYPSLRRFAAVVGSADIDPDDLVQDALLRALRRGPLTDLDHPSAYLRQCICNLAKDTRRSLGRRRRAYAAMAATVSEGFEQTYPSDCAELLRLPPRARAVLYLQEVEGRRPAEIASLLGMSETAVRSLSSRARRRLRRFLSEEVPHATA